MNFPVFEVGGTLDPNAPAETFRSPAPESPLPVLRDPAAETAALQARFEETAAKVNPELYAATTKLERARQTTKTWQAECNRLGALFARQQSQLYGTPGDDIALRELRKVELAPIESALREAREELAASFEEQQAAEAEVDRWADEL